MNTQFCFFDVEKNWRLLMFMFANIISYKMCLWKYIFFNIIMNWHSLSAQSINTLLDFAPFHDSLHFMHQNYILPNTTNEAHYSNIYQCSVMFQFTCRIRMASMLTSTMPNTKATFVYNKEFLKSSELKMFTRYRHTHTYTHFCWCFASKFVLF